MSKRVARPKAAKGKIQTRNEFELCYLRHQYLRKAKYNPTVEQMEPYIKIAINLSKKTFFAYKKLLYLVGLELDDVVNIARVHMVSFLGLYSLERMKEKRIEFNKLFLYVQDRE